MLLMVKPPGCPKLTVADIELPLDSCPAPNCTELAVDRIKPTAAGWEFAVAGSKPAVGGWELDFAPLSAFDTATADVTPTLLPAWPGGYDDCRKVGDV